MQKNPLHLFRQIVHGGIELAFGALHALLVRWIMTLSTPRKDWLWLKSTSFFDVLSRLSWYRGNEFHHQLRAYRLLTGW